MTSWELGREEEAKKQIEVMQKDKHHYKISEVKKKVTVLYIGLAKKFLQFLSKNKRQFSFSLRTLLNNILTSFFHCFLPFLRKLHFSSRQKFHELYRPLQNEHGGVKKLFAVRAKWSV